MNVESFLAHHGLKENPFDAEEARHDRVFTRMLDSSPCHPDFAKILGQFDPPSTSIVFGEKGSGKTAIRLIIERRAAAHNQAFPDRQTLMVVYDHLNEFLDRVIQRRRRQQGRRASVEQLLADFRIEDHQDAILSLAVTELVSTILDKRDGGQAIIRSANLDDRLRMMNRRLRADLGVLAALYDQPPSGRIVPRWRRLRSRLKLGRLAPTSIIRVSAIVVTVVAVALLAVQAFSGDIEWPWLMPLVGGIAVAAALTLWAMWVGRHAVVWALSRSLCRQMPSVGRSNGDLRQMLLDLRRADLDRKKWPWPAANRPDRRYELTARLIEVLQVLGLSGLTVVIDRVDEPTAISGNADRMRSLIWPMLDNKFLQQDRVGLKMLLPIELRHLLHRESAEFFQEARLDKQNLIDRLTWSGATLYDLCSSRLRACCELPDDQSISLTNLFDPDVTRVMIIDALDQMHQPRDAFKFLYNVIQEHCRLVPEDESRFTIARLTLDAIRRAQSDRVQQLYRGLTPA